MKQGGREERGSVVCVCVSVSVSERGGRGGTEK